MAQGEERVEHGAGSLDPLRDLRERPLGPPPVRTPYPALAEARRRGPLLAQGSGAEGETPSFKALSYEAVTTILKNPETFSSRMPPPHFWLTMGHTILHMDEPEHSRYRQAFRQIFSPPHLARWEREVVRPEVGALVDAIVGRGVGRGRADLVGDFTLQLPLHVITRVIGLPEASSRDVHRWIVRLLSSKHDWAAALAAAEEVSRLLRGLVAERRERPRDDVISHVLALEVEGRPLTEYEMLSFLRLLLPTGFETTFRSLGNVLFGLLTNPDQLDAVRADRRLVDPAIEEGLRWETSDLSLTRVCTRDTEVAGVRIPEGSVVLASLASANRDEACYEAPESFDLHRRGPPHTSFGVGPHYCLGAGLSRMEMRVALEILLDRLPGLRLDPAWEDPHIHGDLFRAAETLPVLFDV